MIEIWQNNAILARWPGHAPFWDRLISGRSYGLA
jgi:hypothetical protein